MRSPFLVGAVLLKHDAGTVLNQTAELGKIMIRGNDFHGQGITIGNSFAPTATGSLLSAQNQQSSYINASTISR